MRINEITPANEQNPQPLQFSPAEFLDRAASGEYRGKLADEVDRLTNEERLAAALLLSDRIEAGCRQRRRG